MGCALAVAVPEHWNQPITGTTLTATWGDDSGVRIVPIKVRMLPGRFGTAVWDRVDHPQAAPGFSARRAPAGGRAVDPGRRGGHPDLRAGSRFRPSIFSRSGRPELSNGPALAPGALAERAAGLIAANRVAAGLLSRGRPDVPTTVIPQLGVGIPRMLTPVPHQGFTIGFVGRLVPEKGLDLLLRAWSDSGAGTCWSSAAVRPRKSSKPWRSGWGSRPGSRGWERCPRRNFLDLAPARLPGGSRRARPGNGSSPRSRDDRSHGLRYPGNRKRFRGVARDHRIRRPGGKEDDVPALTDALQELINRPRTRIGLPRRAGGGS